MADRRRGELAAFPVFEAVLVAIFILTAILFVNSFSAPSADTGRGDINLAVVAADTLRVLENREPLDNTTYGNRLEEIVGLAMQGEHSGSDALIDSLIGTQTRYQLRLNNGVEPLHLLPNTSGVQVQPRSAKAAETFLRPNWTVYETTTWNGEAYPGQNVTPDANPVPAYWTNAAGSPTPPPDCVIGPNGQKTMPDGVTTWLSYWRTTPGVVPTDVPLGWWASSSGNGCNTDPPTAFFTVNVMPAGVQNGTPAVYGVQLVVWRVV